MALFFFAMGFCTVIMIKFQKKRTSLHNEYNKINNILKIKIKKYYSLSDSLDHQIVLILCIDWSHRWIFLYIPKEYQTSYSNATFHASLVGFPTVFALYVPSRLRQTLDADERDQQRKFLVSTMILIFMS